jgi:uncharacterized protein (DUF305 family)
LRTANLAPVDAESQQEKIMHHGLKSMLGLSLIATVVACGQSANKEQVSTGQKSADLYKPAAMTMQRTTMEAGGSSPSETYLRKMLAHHEGAIAMSDTALATASCFF